MRYRSWNVRHFKGQSAFTTWIYRILVNACYDFARTRRRWTQERSETDFEDRLSTSASDPPNHLLRLTLERSLEKLGERMRTVFLLFEVEGFKHKEIAEILNISEGASRTLLFEAKKELQGFLWNSGPTFKVCR